jgi:hypothetical protein
MKKLLIMELSSPSCYFVPLRCSEVQVCLLKTRHICKFLLILLVPLTFRYL